MASAADIAAALHLQPSGRGCWRGPCPICGGSRRFQLRTGERAPLLWCFAGCRPEALLARLRELGVLPSLEWTAAEREAWRQEHERRREAEAFAGAARLLADAALEQMTPTDPRRADLASLQMRLLADPVAEHAWWAAHHPQVAAALLRAWAQQERRWRRRAARLVEAAEAMP